MNPVRFDRFTLSLSALRSRRHVMTAAIFGAGSMLGGDDAFAKGKKKHKKKPRPSCNGVPCVEGQYCCGNRI